MKKYLFSVLVALVFATVSQTVMAAPYTGSDYTFLGTEYSAISSRDMSNTPASGEGTWYSTTTGGIWTAWAGLWVEYQAALDVGTWNIGLNVTNHGNLGTGWYSQFEIKNSLTQSVITIPASDNETNYGFITLDINTAGLYTVRYTWKNDAYNPSKGLDANIEIESAFFDNQETAPVPEPATMMLLGTGLVGFAGLRRRKK